VGHDAQLDLAVVNHVKLATFVLADHVPEGGLAWSRIDIWQFPKYFAFLVDS
jgi:hypothetical protein